MAKYISGTKVNGGVVISDFPKIGKITERVIITNFGEVEKI
ncbi:hypothetical protein [Erwinia tracheiphila]|nr:hypothetical protein [Erwinia tracheiphila]